MPFQVVFNTVQIPLPPVVLLSAGSTINVACGTTINLQGEVDIVANLRGHTILWEQLAGVPIVLSSTDTMATSYSFSENSDKIFRLWLDKGRPYQQFKDIKVFHTPTSVSVISLSDSITTKSLPIADVVVCGTISGVLTYEIPNPSIGQPDRTPCQLDGSAPTEGIIFDFTVTWTVPNTKTELVPVFIESELYYADTNIPVASGKYTDAPGSIVSHQFFPGGENELKRYYVITRYNISGVTINGQSCTVDYTGTDIPGVHIIDEIPAVISLTDSSTNIIKFNNLKVINTSSGNISLTDSSTIIIKLNNIFTEGFSVSSLSLSDSSVNIIRYDPTGIGS